MKQIMLISLLFIVACAGINADDVQTDKIQLLFGDYDYKRLHDGAIDDKEKIILDPFNVTLAIRMDIEKVTQVEVRDISSDMKCRHDEIPPSPSTIASFTLNPKANIKIIDIRIQLPCAAYRREFYVMVKVKSEVGNYVMKKKLPAIISNPFGDGL